VQVVEALLHDRTRRRVDQPLADARDLAADLRVASVVQLRALAVGGELHRRRRLDEPRVATPVDHHAVAARLLDIGELHLAAERARDRPDLDLHLADELPVDALELLAARHRRRQHRRVEQRIPHIFDRGVEVVVTGDLHDAPSLRPNAVEIASHRPRGALCHYETTPCAIRVISGVVRMMGEALLGRLFARWTGHPFAIRLWDGQLWSTGESDPTFVIVMRDPSVLADVATGDLERIGETYVRGALDVEGDLLGCFSVLDFLGGAGSERAGPAPERRFADVRDAVNFHYELPGDFFSLFLDPERVYSCAYFRDPTVSLATAQRDKLDLVCRKLRLREGDELLDLGCGWGALALHAASRYGARVTGITLSTLQAEHARDHVARAGLAERCRIEIADLADVGGADRFDKIASVGSVEHILDLPRYFAQCMTLLRTGGLMLNHGISARPSRPLGAGNAFQRKHIFPDHALVPVSAMLAAAEEAGFAVCDVESLRSHYALTLAHWYRRLEASTRQAHAIAGEHTTRAFKAYLAGTSHHFAIGDLDLHQSLLAKLDARGRCSVPVTRDDLYRDEPA
jgi:cyclopropane-fatty-acyl-phospholipid synthase